VTLDDCVRVLEAKGSGWTLVKNDRSYVDECGKPTEKFRLLVERTGRKEFQKHSADSYSTRGVTCFSETPDNTLLWSHYGGDHRGLCLEFDTSSPWLSKLHKVRYTDEIPEFNVADELGGENSRIVEPLLTKAACWSYEEEWRAIHHTAGTVYCYVSHYGMSACQISESSAEGYIVNPTTTLANLAVAAA
jgi:hypothetical protein